MRSYYASYGETFTPYEFYKPQTHATSLVLPKSSTFNSNVIGNDCEINVSLAIKSKYSVPTNAYVAKEFLENLKTAGTTSIPKVDNFFRIAVSYAIINNWTGEMVDETVQIRYAKGETALLELGLSDDEFVAKPALKLKGSISRVYSSKIPYGLMRQIEDHDSYAICIRKIVISQALTASLDMKPINSHAEFANHLSPRCNDYPRDLVDPMRGPRPYYAPAIQPEIQYGDYGNRVQNPYTEFVTVYDSEAAGMIFEPITVRRIVRLTIKVEFITTDFVAIISDKVNAILEENATPIPPITQPDEPETPSDNGSGGTAKPIEPADDPDSPYDKEDTGSGDTTENSGGDTSGDTSETQSPDDSTNTGKGEVTDETKKEENVTDETTQVDGSETV